MKRIFSSTWVFLKSAKWHILLSPVYLVLGGWTWNLAVILACKLAGLEWSTDSVSVFAGWTLEGKVFTWIWPIGVDIISPVFTWPFIAVCFGIAAAAYLLMRSLPPRLVFARRAIAIVGMLLQVAVVAQILHIMVRRASVGDQLDVFAVSLSGSLVCLWLVVREFSRVEPSLSPGVTRIVPTALFALCTVVGVMFYLGDSWLAVRLAIAKVALTEGPIKAEIYSFGAKYLSGYRDAPGIEAATAAHVKKLKCLIERRPQDPAVDKARLTAAMLGFRRDTNIVEALKLVNGVRENAESYDWAQSRTFASRFLAAKQPPDLEGALRELDRVDCGAFTNARVPYMVLSAKTDVLAKLGRMEEAAAVARSAVEARDAMSAKSGSDPAGQGWVKGRLLIQAGLTNEAEKAIAGYFEFCELRRAKERAKQCVAGKVFIADPVGKDAPVLAGTDIATNNVSLADYKGRYVFVDFWATWCPPCMAELPNLLTAYEELKTNGVDVVGVSLDKDKPSLLKVVKEKRIPWPVIQAKGKDREMIPYSWGVENIPATFLVGPDGKVLATNIRGPDMAKQLFSIIRGGSEKQ